MTAIEHILRRARRRVVADRAVRQAGAGLAVGAGIGLGALVLDRVIGFGVRLEVFGILAGVGLLIGAIHALLHRLSAFDLAVRLDRQLGLRDRLGTAEVIRTGQVPDDDFAALVRQDAQRLADSIDLKSATPIRITRIWAVAAAMAAALGLGIAYLPTFAWANHTQPPIGAAELDQQRRRIVQAIGDAVADLSDETLDEQSRDDLDALSRLAQQLANQPSSETELAQARDHSAARLEELAAQLADEAQSRSDAADAVARRFAGIDTPDAPMSADQFTEALRRGEFGEAAKLFDQLIESRDEMPPSTRRELADHLRQISEHLKESQDSAQAESAEREQALREAMRDLDVNEQTISDLLDQQRPQEQIEQRLQDRDLDEEIARRLAHDVHRRNEQQQAQAQADERARSVADALDQAADQIEPAASEDRKDQGRADQPDQQAIEPEHRGTGQPPSAEPAEQPSSDATARASEESEPRSIGRPETAPQQRPVIQPGKREEQDLRDHGPESVGDALRQLERARRAADDRRAASKRFRQAARNLADTLTEEQRQRLAQQWLGNLEDQPGTGSGDIRRAEDRAVGPLREEENLDLRTDAEADIVIAQWLSKELRAGKPQRVGRTAAPVSRARAAAEQAVEDSVVPSRYHSVIQRYFGRLKDTVDRAAAQSAAEESPRTPAAPKDDGGS